MRCRYNAVNVLLNPQYRLYIARCGVSSVNLSLSYIRRRLAMQWCKISCYTRPRYNCTRMYTTLGCKISYFIDVALHPGAAICGLKLCRLMNGSRKYPIRNTMCMPTNSPGIVAITFSFVMYRICHWYRVRFLLYSTSDMDDFAAR